MIQSTSLAHLISMPYAWQVAARKEANTKVIQSEIANVRESGGKLIITFLRSAEKVIGEEPVIWSPVKRAKEMVLSADDQMELQPCGSYFGPNERYALVPNNSTFWITPESWPQG